jgi:hypothetical protein
MSKRRENGRIKLLLPVALDMCKTTAGRSWQFFRSVFQSIAARTRHDHLKVDQITNVSHSLLTDSSCRQNMEFEEVMKVLNIGDRIRVLCNDGVVVAEKISQTQFELIHYQAVSGLIH